MAKRTRFEKIAAERIDSFFRWPREETSKRYQRLRQHLMFAVVDWIEAEAKARASGARTMGITKKATQERAQEFLDQVLRGLLTDKRSVPPPTEYNAGSTYYGQRVTQAMADGLTKPLKRRMSGG